MSKFNEYTGIVGELRSYSANKNLSGLKKKVTSLRPDSTLLQSRVFTPFSILNKKQIELCMGFTDSKLKEKEISVVFDNTHMAVMYLNAHGRSSRPALTPMRTVSGTPLDIIPMFISNLPQLLDGTDTEPRFTHKVLGSYQKLGNYLTEVKDATGLYRKATYDKIGEDWFPDTKLALSKKEVIEAIAHGASLHIVVIHNAYFFIHPRSKEEHISMFPHVSPLREHGVLPEVCTLEEAKDIVNGLEKRFNLITPLYSSLNVMEYTIAHHKK